MSKKGRLLVVSIAMFLVPKVIFRTNEFIPSFSPFFMLSLSDVIDHQITKKKVKSERRNFKLTARLKLVKTHAGVEGVWTDRVRWEYSRVYENGIKMKYSRMYEKASRKQERSQLRLLYLRRNNM